MKNSPDGTGKFLASARPVLTALVAVLVFSFILIPQKSEGGIYAPNPPPALIPETPGPPPPWRTYAWIPGPLAMAPQPIRLGSWRHYQRPPLGANRWIHGHWLQDHRGWFWIEGYCSD